MNIIEVAKDKNLAGPWFQGKSWEAWFTFLTTAFGLPLSSEQEAIYNQRTGRKDLPTGPSREAWVVVGRRGGKSLMAALVTTYLACFRDYTSLLGPGETGTLMVLAADRRQARTVLRYINGFFSAIPMLSALVVNQTRESIELSNRVMIEIHTASFRSTRGYTLVAAICDEIAFWRSDESANPDTEIIAALRPGLATIPGSLLMCISSPYARRGALWNAYQKHYGQNGDPVLVWQADTRSMNPSVPEYVINEAYQDDPISAAAEYGAEFRRDIESYVPRESVEACVIPGRFELPYSPSFRYFAFTDPSGGSQDSWTLAIAHAEGERLVLDLVREWRPPFSPDSVVTDCVVDLKRYRITHVMGDRYGGEFPRELFRKRGITYNLSDKTKSTIYHELLPPINSGRIELLDNQRLIVQLCGLERRTSRGGRDSIDHSPKSHDDVINASAGALLAASGFGQVTGGTAKLRGL